MVAYKEYKGGYKDYMEYKGGDTDYMKMHGQHSVVCTYQKNFDVVQNKTMVVYLASRT
jgi:hypothetical protein